MGNQKREATPKDIDNMVKSILKVDLDLMAIGLSKSIKQKIIDDSVNEAKNKSRKRVKKILKKFRATGNKQKDSDILNKKILIPVIESAREIILNKVITQYPMTLKRRIQIDGYGIENPNNKKYLERKVF